MQPELVYQKFLLKINKGNTNFNISCDKPRFVLIFNEAKNRWVETFIKQKDSKLIDSLQEIIKSEEILAGIDKGTYIEYQLPEDFYEDISLSCEVEKENCKKVIYSREIKNQNSNLMQFDKNQQPDFDFEWTFHKVISNTIRVYKRDFSIKKIVFTYYSVIPFFDIEGYININGSPSVNIPINLSEQYVDQIINFAAEEYMRDFENINGLNIAKDRVNNQE